MKAIALADTHHATHATHVPTRAAHTATAPSSSIAIESPRLPSIAIGSPRFPSRATAAPSATPIPGSRNSFSPKNLASILRTPPLPPPTTLSYSIATT
jgi:hypothetical protein